MPAVSEATQPSALLLSVLSEEEKMFQASIRRFARERIGPHVRAM